MGAELPDPSGDWRTITQQSIRQAIPAERFGSDVELVPVRLLYTFSSTTFFELSITLKKTRPESEPEAIVIANGTYGLEDLELIINDPAILRRVDDRVFTAYRPIFVAPTASLVISNQELRLSLPDVSSLIYRGSVFITDSVITTWDEKTGDFGVREPLAEEQLFTIGTQPARPFLLGLRGSRSYFAGSQFTGLGYQGRSSTYGLSLAARDADAEGLDAGLRHMLLSLPRPIGIFVGNTISQSFFGFYLKKAGPTVLLGNLFQDSVVYNIDPHDYSEGLVIARNLAVGARHKHGIIISREVDGARIEENISAFNSGTGIMIDRQSANAVVNNNLVFANQADGIAIYESQGTQVAGNLLFGNARNGIYLRNSPESRIENNLIDQNGNFGVEIGAKVLDSRAQDDALDPYKPISDVQVIDNGIHRNLDAALAAKGEVTLMVRGNDFGRSAPQFFSGDLGIHASEILEKNSTQGFEYTAGKGDIP
jgi:poly(beta-D-mannuronate) C5 epimerase